MAKAIGIDLGTTNSALAHDQYAMYLAAMGRLGEAVSEARRAQTLDAMSPIVNTDLGWCLLYAGRGTEAVDQFRKTLELDSKYVSARWGLGAAYAQQRSFKEAVAELTQAVTLSGCISSVRSNDVPPVDRFAVPRRKTKGLPRTASKPFFSQG